MDRPTCGRARRAVLGLLTSATLVLGACGDDDELEEIDTGVQEDDGQQGGTGTGGATGTETETDAGTATEGEGEGGDDTEGHSGTGTGTGGTEGDEEG